MEQKDERSLKDIERDTDCAIQCALNTLYDSGIVTIIKDISGLSARFKDYPNELIANWKKELELNKDPNENLLEY